MKTSELNGAALDWAVTKCEGYEYYQFDGKYGRISTGQYFNPHNDWAQGGPIIERKGINVCIQHDEPHIKIASSHRWYAQLDHRVWTGYGPTPLIAAMRCYVASKLGEEVEIPEELL